MNGYDTADFENWITPDDILDLYYMISNEVSDLLEEYPKSYTFIYDGNKLYIDDGLVTHYEIMIQNNLDGYETELLRDKLEAEMLVGRLGAYCDFTIQRSNISEDLRAQILYRVYKESGIQEICDNIVTMVVSFWNTNKKLYNTLLPGCMQKLQPYIDKRCPAMRISTPENNMISTHDTFQAEETPQEIKDQVALQRRLHLLRGDEKRAAMQELGLIDDDDTTIKQHPWQAAMRDKNLIAPGQKWWAPTSEDILTDCDEIFRQLND